MQTKFNSLAIDDKMQDLVQDILPLYFQKADKIEVAWAAFEQSMDCFIWDLAVSDNPLGACVTSSLNSLTHRIQIIVTMLQHKGWSTDTVEKFLAFDGWIHDLREGWNMSIQDMILVGPKLKHPTDAAGRKAVVYEAIVRALGNMSIVLIRSQEMITSFDDLANDVRRHVRPVQLSADRRVSAPLPPFTTASIWR